VVFVCDLTDRESLDKLEIWVSYAYKYIPESSFVFLANKADLPDSQFGLEELREYAQRFKSPSFLTSAKTGDHVEESFIHIASSIHQNKFVPPVEQVDLKVPTDDEVPSPRIWAEDKMINTFCQEAGGFHVSMPIVRQHFHKHGIDFETANKEELSKIIESLTKYLVFIKGEDVAKVYYRKMKKVLKEMD